MATNHFYYRVLWLLLPLLILFNISAWSTTPVLSDFNFGSPLVDEDFNDLSTCANKPGNTKSTTTLTSQTAYGVFSTAYVGKSADDGFAIRAAATPFTTKYLEIIKADGKYAGLSFTNASFSTKGAFDIYVSKSSSGQFGFYNGELSENANNKSSVYFKIVTGASATISSNSGGGWTTVGSSSSALIRVTVVYNTTNSAASYGDGISLGSKTAHVYIDGTCIMNGENPKAFALYGNAPSSFRIWDDQSTSILVDDLKIYSALPTAAGTSVSLTKAGQTNGSFTLTQSSTPVESVTTTSAAQAVTVTATPATGYYLSNLTASNPTTGTASVTGSGNTRTVTYTQEANGSSTITATFSPIWELRGSFTDDWVTNRPLNSTNISDGVGTITIDLSANTTYFFKFYNVQEAAYYKNEGAIVEDVSGWTFSSGDGDNTRLFTGKAGTYTFKYTIATKALQVIYPTVTDHPNSAYNYFKKNGSWGSNYYVHWWDGSGDPLNAWGSDHLIAKYTTICDEDYIYFPILTGYPNLIVKDNYGDTSNKTGDLSSTGNGGKYHDGSSWESFEKYTISYAAGTGGSGSMSAHSNLCPGVDQDLTANDFERDHYHFTGWTTTVDVTVDGETVEAGELIGDEKTIENVQSDIALTAQWAINQHTLSWVWNSGSTSGSYTAGGTKDYGATITYPASNTMSRTGYDFNNFTSSPSGNPTTMPDQNLTITANWTAQTYNITYKDQGNVPYSGNATAGVPTGAPTTHTYNEATALVNGSKTGYAFNGWYTDKECTTSAGSSIAASSITADITLYAKWTALAIVSFSVPDGVSSVADQYAGDELPEADVPSACGDCWEFAGWSVDPDEDGSGTILAAGTTYSPGSDVTLYAVYHKDEFKWVQVTDSLVNNGYYVLTSLLLNDDEYALSNTITNTNDASVLDINDPTDYVHYRLGAYWVYNPPASIIWKLTGSTDNWSLYNEAETKYLDLSSSSSPILQSSTDNKLKFSVQDMGEGYFKTFNISDKTETGNYLSIGTSSADISTEERDEENYSAYVYKRVYCKYATSPTCDSYTVTWDVNHAATTSETEVTACVSELDDSDLPDVDDDVLEVSNDGCIPNGKGKFMGWSATDVGAIDGQNAPTDLFDDAEGSPYIKSDKTFYAIFATKGTTTGGDIKGSTEMSTAGWSTSGTNGYYSSNGPKFDSKGDYIQSGDISGQGAKYVVVEMKAGYNSSGGSGSDDASVFTIATIDADGNVIDSEDLKPTESYDNQSTTYTFVLSGDKVIKYVRVTLSSYKKYAATKYCLVTPYKDFRTYCCEKYGIAYGIESGEGTDPTGIESACEDESITITPHPATGYEYGGASVLDEDDGTIATLDANTTSFTMEAKDAYVYVTYSPKQYTVTLKPNGATSGSNQEITATFDADMPSKLSDGTTPVAAPTKTGYTFGGFVANSDGSGKQYYAADLSSANEWDQDVDDAEIYAKWTPIKYKLSVAELTNVTIKATVDASDITMGNNANVDCDKSVTLSYSGLVSGKVWGGWKVIKDADESNVTASVVDGNTLTMPAYDVTVSAVIYGDLIAWCDPQVTVSDGFCLTSYYVSGEASTKNSVYTTSAAGNLLTINSTDLGGVDRIEFIYLDGGDNPVALTSSPFRMCNDGSENYNVADPGTSATSWTKSSLSNTCALSYSIRYKPTDYNMLDNYKLKMVFKKGASDVRKTIVREMNGRSLPEEFVIAVKGGNQWYALPNTLKGTQGDQGSIVPVKITVDNPSGTPTRAEYAPTTAIYKGRAKFATANPSSMALTSTGSNYLQTSSASGVYQMWLSSSGDADDVDWYFKSSNRSVYELAMDPVNSPSKKMAFYDATYMGYYGGGASTASYDIYLLPVENKYTDIPATVTEWGRYSVILAADPGATATKAQARIDTGSPTEDQTITAINAAMGTAKNVKVPVGDIDLADLASNEGKLLYIDWFNGSTPLGSSVVKIPRIVAEDRTANKTNDTDKKVWNTEVHVLPGATLTIDGNTFVTGVINSTISMKELHVYPGATVNVSTGKLSASTLRLRNGWTRAGTKKYDVARVYINASNDAALEKTTASMDYDIYEQSDGKHYYPLAVPFETAVSGIDYADTYLAGFSTYGTHYVVKEYNGARRAQSGPDQANNWTVVADDATLSPGKGYIMTAVAVKGEAIIRVPLTFDNGWTADGEKASYGGSTKNVVAVSAYDGTAASAHDRHKGWNMLGVPFMSCYGAGMDMYSGGDASLINGELVVNTDADQNMEYQSTTIPYVSVPSHDFAEYVQTDITETKLLPGWSFFVQVDADGDLTFAVSNQRPNNDNPIYAPKRSAVDEVLRTGIILSDGEASDKTTILISDQYSGADYEIGADLEKMFGNGYTLATYSLSGSTRLAYNAMSKSDATAVIPIGYRAPAEGEYTFSLNPKYAEANFERVDLIDYQTGSLTNLMTSSYTFTTGRTQDDSRFALNVVMKPTITTDVENGANGENDANGVEKVIIDDHMYIIRSGKMYDATGKTVREINK